MTGKENSAMIPVMLAESVSTPASGIQNALTTGFQSIASDMTTTVTNVLPIILGIVGLFSCPVMRR